ncbi:MAG: hypothetical protein WA865_07950 [Spirulinaceae cyanobacterium]
MKDQQTDYQLQEETLSGLENLEKQLLDYFLEQENPYPWNPGEVETEAYFEATEENFSLAGWSTTEIEGRTETLFRSLNSCWPAQSSFSFQEVLDAKFGSVVPSSWLEAIAQEAKKMVDSNLSKMERLVESIKPLLPNWTEEDLQVFARPLVYAMRSSQKNKADTVLSKLEKTNWEDISPVEKARLSLAIAQYAFTQVDAHKQG